MAKIFVDVSTPGNGKTYEFHLDDTLTVEAAKNWMAEEIRQIEENGIVFNECLLLSNLDLKHILPDNTPLSMAGVESGHTLILV
jgi:hypothetical protein